MTPEVLKGHVDSILLAVLEPEALHGYAIMETLRTRSPRSDLSQSHQLWPAG